VILRNEPYTDSLEHCLKASTVFICRGVSKDGSADLRYFIVWELCLSFLQKPLGLLHCQNDTFHPNGAFCDRKKESLKAPLALE
jgi:hypothetical protein